MTMLLKILIASIFLLVMIQVSFADISITTSTFDSQPVWAEWDYGSGDTILLSTLAGTFYRSVGGRNFVDQTSLIPDWGAVNAPFQRSGLRGVVATNDANKLYLVGFSNIWVTSDAGATYQKRPYDSTLIINAILPHPYNSDIALMSSYTMSCYSSDKSTCYQRLFVTTDFGLTWRAIATYVQRYRWASNANNQVPRIYASIFATKSGNQFNLPAQNAALYLSDDYFNTNRLLLSNVSSFAIKSNFVDAAYHSTSGQAEMWTSGNYGKSFIHFDVPNWAYAIVLTPYVSSQTIFMMPSSQLPTYSMFGQAWHSDVTGANFVRSSSIMSVLSSGVEFHYDPLIPGVFFANFVEMGSSGPVRYTQVSRNNGGSWALLPAPTIDSTGRPTNCDLSRGCSLHLVLALTQPGSFVINPTSPGVIICRGNYGMFYNPDPTAQNTFISSDAGSTWREIAKGSQTTAIAEYGSLIVAAPLTSPTSTISYSFDQGASWSTYPLGSTEQILIVVSSPSNDTGVFLALSTRKAFILNFPKNLVRTCSSSDYYTWSPKDPLGHNCLLGTTWIVTSRQPSSACIPGGPPAPIRYGASCSCTACDYECAFGYAAIPPSPDCTPLEYPTRSPSQPSTTRRISGDGCSSARSEIDIAVV